MTRRTTAARRAPAPFVLLAPPSLAHFLLAPPSLVRVLLAPPSLVRVLLAPFEVPRAARLHRRARRRGQSGALARLRGRRRERGDERCAARARGAPTSNFPSTASLVSRSRGWPRPLAPRSRPPASCRIHPRHIHQRALAKTATRPHEQQHPSRANSSIRLASSVRRATATRALRGVHPERVVRLFVAQPPNLSPLRRVARRDDVAKASSRSCNIM